MKSHFKGVLAGGLYVFCNYVIANIPCWHIRKALYLLCGMKIGRHSRIMMKAVVTHPWKICIGKNTIVNEHCYLDGRGGLRIGDNVNIALHAMLVTGSHDHRSSHFDYFAEPIHVEDDVWIATRAVVLNGCILGKGCLISVGAVVVPRTECCKNGMYGGVPARLIKERGLDDALKLGKWDIHFR